MDAIQSNIPRSIVVSNTDSHAFSVTNDTTTSIASMNTNPSINRCSRVACDAYFVA
uniref:Uncharacterized protein n=1 Tax=Globisporangium ultimum (strain ATCC 200006 / CBS 805.95 / DAOM BR144) TaxID=431595 RepID=K3WVT9_GLOUD